MPERKKNETDLDMNFLCSRKVKKKSEGERNLEKL